MSVEDIFKYYGFTKSGVDEEKLARNATANGNLNLFHQLNLDAGHGPKYPYTGLWIFTKFPGQTWKILLARKCFGGDPVTNQVGERYKVGHTYLNGEIVDSFGDKSGAAGTRKEFWGKWVSIGGRNDPNVETNVGAALSEFRDEANVDHSISQGLHIIDNYTYSRAMIYMAYLPPDLACQIDDTRGTNADLIFSSRGEIAELKWVPYDHVLDNSVCRNGLTNYAQETYRRVEDYINWIKSIS